MFRSLLRMLKHITFAVIAIIATVCVAEVGLRGHRLYQRCQGGGSSSCALTPKPCPIAFWHLAPLTHVTRTSPETGEPFDIRTNSLGLRGPEVSLPKPPGVFRIVCLGDEATFAPDIAISQTFPALVDAALAQQSEKPIEVINAGIPGFCPLLSLAWARHRLTSLQPDLVILCCDASDVADNRRVRPLAKYSDDGVLLSVSHPTVSQRPQSLLQAVEKEFQLAALLSRQAGESLYGTDSQNGNGASGDLPEGWDVPSPSEPMTDSIHVTQTWEPIAPLRDLCDRLSADFVVTIVPSEKTSDTMPGGTNAAVRQLGEVTEELGIPYLDVTAEFAPASSTPLFLRDGGALSTAGHQEFAELLTWAIVHRDGGSTMDDASSSPITPAVAEEISSPPPDVPTSVEGPSPLPTLGRQPRTDSSIDWSR